MRITLRRRRAGHRLQLHDRHRRLVGGRAAARSPGAAADRPRRRRDRGDLAATCCSHTHATSVGAITSLALAAIDTALWDLALPPRRRSRCGSAAGGAQQRVPVYTTEGGWLHLVADAAGRRGAGGAGAAGFSGAKIKVGKPHVAEDVARLRRCARRSATASRSWSTPTSASRVAEALRRARALRARSSSPGSRSRCRPTTSPATCELAARGADADRGRRVAVLDPAQFREYLRARRLLDRAGRRARASAASRPGSRSRTWPRPSTSRSARTS